MEFLNFGEAFRDAKRAGEKTFMYKGKRYSTDLAAAKNPYEDKSRTMEGLEARRREMARPGRDAIEGVYPEAALIPAARGAAGAARLVAAAMKAMKSDKTGDWREKMPEGADPAKWREIVKKIDEAYPSGGGASRTPSRGSGVEEKNAVLGKTERTTRSPRSRTREEIKPEFRSRTADRMDERQMAFNKGGMAKKKQGYAKGGMAMPKASNCGASMKPQQRKK